MKSTIVRSLTVIALAILTTGTIKNFAINMIVGIVEGTYSTFISAFIVIEWTKSRDKRRKAGELSKYGIAPEKALTAEAVDAAEDEEEAEAEEAAEGLASTEPLPEPAAGVGALAAEAVVEPGAGPANVIAFPGNTGSRKHKKHRRRHH